MEQPKAIDLLSIDELIGEIEKRTESYVIAYVLPDRMDTVITHWKDGCNLMNRGMVDYLKQDLWEESEEEETL